jgi:hypothetical protein
MPAASAAVDAATDLDAQAVQLAGADIAAKLELAGERAQKLVALLDRDRDGQLHHTAELLVGQANHG